MHVERVIRKLKGAIINYVMLSVVSQGCDSIGVMALTKWVKRTKMSQMHDVIYTWPNCFFGIIQNILKYFFVGFVILKNCFRLKLTKFMLVTSNLSRYQRSGFFGVS